MLWWLIVDKEYFYLNNNIEFSSGKEYQTQEFAEKICERRNFKEKGDLIASVRIFADPTHVKESNKLFGIPVPIKRGRHTFITIENISTKDIQVGKVVLPPHKTISLGVFSMMKTKEHSGLWMCMEARNILLNGFYGPRASLRCDITENDLSNINAKLKKFYNRWNYYHNCAYFCRVIWNLVSSLKIKRRIVITPLNIYEDIIKTQKHTIGYPVPFQYLVHYIDDYGKPCKSRFWNRKWV